LTKDSPELEKHRPIEGATRTTVTIDPAHGQLTMRYSLNKQFRFAVYDLEQVKARNYAPLADVAQPAVGTFQGYASYGGYLYLLEGNANPMPGNTYITAVKWKTGEVVDRQLISAGSDVSFREPEGMAIRLPDERHPHKAELSFGFASGNPPTRLANLFALDRLKPEQALDKDENSEEK